MDTNTVSTNMAPLFTTKPAMTPVNSLEIQRVVHFLTNHFQVRQPKIKITNTRRGKYSVLHETIIMGPKCWRGVHTVVHEFAHHLDMVRRGHAGTFMARPRVRVNGWTVSTGRREFHGESFTLALEECVMAVFGNQNLYAWETEYKSVKANHAKRFRHIENAQVPPPVVSPIGSTGWLVHRVPARPALQLAAEPKQTVVSTDTKTKLRKVANAAWAAPSADNGWQGGCLWRKFKGGK